MHNKDYFQLLNVLQNTLSYFYFRYDKQKLKQLKPDLLTVEMFLTVACVPHVTLVCVNIMYENIDQTLVNSLHGLLNCEIGRLDCDVITTEYRAGVHCIHLYHLLFNALVNGIYS